MILISGFIYYEHMSYHQNIQIIKWSHTGMILIFIIILFCNISTEMITPEYDQNSDDYNVLTRLLWIPGSASWFRFVSDHIVVILSLLF